MRLPDTFPMAVAYLFLVFLWSALLGWFVSLSGTRKRAVMDSEFGTLSQRMASACTMLVLAFLSIIFCRELLGYAHPSTAEELYNLFLTTAADSIGVVIVAHAAFIVATFLSQRSEIKREAEELKQKNRKSG